MHLSHNQVMAIARGFGSLPKVFPKASDETLVKTLQNAIIPRLEATQRNQDDLRESLEKRDYAAVTRLLDAARHIEVFPLVRDVAEAPEAASVEPYRYRAAWLLAYSYAAEHFRRLPSQS